jgi:hypothetical protein
VMAYVTQQPVTRFEYGLADGRQFRNMTRPVVAVSSDGRYFVYNSSDGLYQRELGKLEARLIPGTSDVLTNPFLSPDGQSVGCFQENELRRMPIEGGVAVAICQAANPLGVAWASDNTIWFGQPAGIMRVSADGGTPELAIKAADSEQVYGPQPLPDGDSVPFSTTTTTGVARWDDARIVVQSLSTGNGLASSSLRIGSRNWSAWCRRTDRG